MTQSTLTGTQPQVCPSLGELPARLQRWQARRIFAAIDPVMLEARAVRELLGEETITWQVFNAVKPNPDVNLVRAALDTLGTTPPDVWLAIGGGTTIDLMKLVACAAPRRDSMIDIFTGHAPAARMGGRFVAVPTTAGTGSEATRFAVVYVDRIKHSVEHPTLLPDVAVLDASLTESLPPGVTAHTGLDALCQAVESWWSVGSTPASRQWAAEALELAWRTLPTAVHRPNPAARRDMLIAAHLAGRAINVSKTTAAHAMSYALSIGYGVPHGAAVALNLASLLRFNAQVTEADCADPRGPDHVRAIIGQIQDLLGCGSADEAAATLTARVNELGCPTRLSQIGITSAAQIAPLVEQVNIQRLGNNPRRITLEQQRALWEQIR